MTFINWFYYEYEHLGFVALIALVLVVGGVWAWWSDHA